MACRIDVELCKTPAEVKLRGFDYGPFLANAWVAGAVVVTDYVIRPPRANGYQYRVVSPGQSGTRAPNFRATDGAEVRDGTVLWAAEPVDDASLRATIATSVWSADDAAVTFSGEVVDNTGGIQRTSANIHGGDAGVTYTVVNTVTMTNGEKEEMGIELEITDGAAP